MEYVALGKRIRAHRRWQNMTQEALAERAGISLSFLGHIERGSRKASVETLVAIANALKVSLDELLQDSLYESDSPTPIPSTKRQIDLINEISRVIIENYDA